MIDRKSLREGDEIWSAHATIGGGGPAAWVRGGVVIAAGQDGSVVYRDHAGGVDTIASWSVATLHKTEADAWLGAASRLATLAAEVADKAAECRVKALGEEVAA